MATTQRRMDGDDLFVPHSKRQPPVKRPDRVHVEIRDEMAVNIIAAAKRYNISPSEFVKQAVQFALDRMEA